MVALALCKSLARPTVDGLFGRGRRADGPGRMLQYLIGGVGDSGVGDGACSCFAIFHGDLLSIVALCAAWVLRTTVVRNVLFLILSNFNFSVNTFKS